MKQGIHPQYEPTVIKCACGAEFETRSTKKDLRVEICSKCHPFFTGRQKLVDTGGRVDRFNKRFGLTIRFRLPKAMRQSRKTGALPFCYAKMFLCLAASLLLLGIGYFVPEGAR